MTRITAKRLLSCVLCLAPTIAHSQEEHRYDFLPGSKAPFMGGAFTAIADDPSGAFYNPAGLAFGSKSEVSVSATALNVRKTTYRSALHGDDFVETSQSFVPIFAGSLLRVGKLSIGHSYMTIDAESIDQSFEWQPPSDADESVTSLRRDLLEEHSYLLAGGSLAFKVSSNFSVGVTTYYYARTLKTMDHQLTSLVSGGVDSTYAKVSTQNSGLWLVPGIQYRESFFSIGVSGWRGLEISSSTRANFNRFQQGEAGSNGTLDAPEVGRPEQNPSTVRAGMAFHLGKHLTVALDCIHHFGVEGKKKEDKRLVDTTNYSAGADISIGRMQIRLGAFSNFTMYPDIEEGLLDQDSHIDYLGTSMGLAYNGPRYQGGLGVVRQIGKGTAQLIGGSSDVQDVETSSLTLILTGEYRL